MRFINKTSSPSSLELWKINRKAIGQSCTYGDLSGQPKNDLKTALLAEQKSLCCYCQQVISNGSSTIEHFLPQAKFKLHEVDYLNMHLVCAYSRSFKAKDTYCDVKKENDLIINLILHPDCESFFRYSSTGEILPRNYNYGNYKTFLKNMNKLSTRNQSTLHLIRVLNLNTPDLINKRKKEIKSLFKLLNKKFDTVLKIDAYLAKEAVSPKSSRFPSLIKYYLEKQKAKLKGS